MLDEPEKEEYCIHGILKRYSCSICEANKILSAQAGAMVKPDYESLYREAQELVQGAFMVVNLAPADDLSTRDFKKQWLSKAIKHMPKD